MCKYREITWLLEIVGSHFHLPYMYMYMIHLYRCLFASNFPVDKVAGSFKQLMSVLEPILDSYSIEDKQKFFAGNARKFYRL